MIKLLTGGGFGDAAMSIGKFYSQDAPFDVNTRDMHLMHVEVPGELLEAIREFYKTQGIDASVTQIPSWDWKDRNRYKFDYYLGAHWSKHNIGDETTWEINPFPPLKYNVIDNIDTIVNISGGRKDKFRGFSTNEIMELDKRLINITFTGKSDDPFYNEYEFENTNLVNKTSVQEFVDLICSCDTYVGYAGFALFLAGLANKNIYGFKTNGDGWDYRVHPKWKVKKASNISEVIDTIKNN